MTTDQTKGWLRPTLTLCGLWFVMTVLTVVLQTATRVAVPAAVVRIVPFLVSGWLTGRLGAVSTGRPRLIATIVLVLLSSLAWTSFTVITRSLSLSTALTLLGASLPVLFVASAWAWLGMYLGARTSPPAAPASDPELDAREREVREQMARGEGTPTSGPSRAHREDGPER
jgi:hypothetical protein